MTERILRFGAFELRPEREQLLNGGVRVGLGSRALAILALLAEHAGEVLSIQEITEHVWPNLFVQENNLRVHMSAIRRALRTAHDGDVEIVNIPGRGYRLSADVVVEHAGEDVLDAPPPPSFRPLPLPLQINRLIGRDDKVAQVVQTLREHRLVTIVGAGGIGKTSVALAALDVLGEGTPTCFVDLTNCSTVEHVAAAAATALQSPMGRDTTPSVLVDHLRTSELILLLDNCEHLLKVVAHVAEVLLRSCSQVKLLATSREPLRVPGEMQVRLQPLPVPAPTATAQAIADSPAVALFSERLAAAAGGFAVDPHNARQIATICRSLDGLPLALELAAAAVPVVGLEALASGLTQRLSLLAFGRRTVARHETLEAMLDWSFELLDRDERSVFGCLSCFRSSFDLAAAVQVAALEEGEETRTGQAVLQLAAKSLLVVEPSAHGVAYRLLETTKVYARRKLDESGQAAVAARRHASWVGGVLARAQADWLRLDRVAWWERYGHTIDDVRAALAWSLDAGGDQRLGIRLTIASAPLWLGVSQFGEYNAWLVRALDTLNALGEGGGQEEMQLQIGLCVLHYNADRPGDAFVRAASQVLRIGEQLGDPLGRATGLWLLSGHRTIMGDHQAGLALAEQMLGPDPTALDADLQAFARRVIAIMMFRAGRVEESTAISSDVVAKLTGRGAYSAVLRYDHSTVSRGNHAVALAVQGRLESAKAMIMEAAIDAHRLRNPSSFCYLLASAACPIALWLGDDDLARHYAKLLTHNAEANYFTYMAELGAWFSRIADLRLGKPPHPLALDKLRPPLPHDRDVFITTCAALCDAESVARADTAAPNWATAEILRADGEGRRRTGERAAARARFEQALALAEAQGCGLWALRAATSLARLAAPGEVSAILAPVLARIEGDDQFADVRAARGLLAEPVG